MINSMNSIAIVTSRVALLEIELKKMSGILERLTYQMATGGGVLDKSKPKFKTPEQMADEYLKNQLTKEQYELVLSNKRDESTSRFRGEVICNLYKRGVSGIAISRVIKKDHNTIYYHLALNGLVKAKDNKKFSARKQSRLARMRRRIAMQLR
jgi:hypothetical protein